MSLASLLSEALLLLIPIIIGLAVLWRVGSGTQKEKLAFGFIANWLLCYFFKYLFIFPRLPVHFGTLRLFDPAMPSFHTQAAFFVAALMLFFYRGSPRLRAKLKWPTIVLFALAALVMAERYSLGRHTPVEILVGALLGIAFAWLAFKWKTKSILDGELIRQATHLFGAGLGIIALLTGQYAAALVSFLAAFVVYLSFRGKITALNGWKEFLSRPGESWHGSVGYFLSIGAVLAIFPLPIALVSILALAVGDSATNVFGRMLGKARWPEPFNTKKTYMGSLFGFVSVFAILSLSSSLAYPNGSPVLFYFKPALLLLVSAIAAYAEALAPRDMDNVYIPFSVALVLYFQPFLHSLV